MTVNRLPYSDPLRAGRHPFQTYLLALCVVSGAPMAAGQVTANSLEEQLPEPLVIAWGVMLVFGAVVALFGSYARVSYATALTLERVGLWSTGGAAIVYGAIIMFSGSWGGFVAACIIFGFGVACTRRARDIGHIFQRALSSNPPTVDREVGR